MFSDDRLTERLDLTDTAIAPRGPRDVQLEEIVALAADVLGAQIALVAAPGALGAHFLAQYGMPEPWRSLGYIPPRLARAFRMADGATPLSVEDFQAWAPASLTRRIPGLTGGTYLGIPFARPEGRLAGVLAFVRLERQVWSQAEIARAQSFARLVEQRLAEQARVRHWRAGFEQSDSGYILGLPVRDVDDRVRDILVEGANGLFDHLTGHSRAPGLLARWPEAAPLLVLAARMTAGGGPHRIELPGPGGRDWYEVRLRRLVDGRLGITFYEINGHRKTRIRLTEQEERRRLANRLADIGVWDYEPGTGKLTFDDDLRGMMGLTTGHHVSKQEAIAAVEPEDRQIAREEIGALIGGLRPEGTRFTVRVHGLDDRRLRHILVSANLHPAGGPIRLIGAARDISARVEREQRDRLLQQELGHRLKNTMTLVVGLTNQTFRTANDMEGARTALLARIHALGAAHDHILLGGGAAAAMADVARSALAFGDFGEDRVRLSGPELRLGPHSALHLSLVLHELATNAVKYGALSRDAGCVSIGWFVEGDRAALDWQEIGGPPVRPPAGKGFGTRLVRTGLTGGEESVAELDFRPEGFFCRLAAPRAELER